MEKLGKDGKVLAGDLSLCFEVTEETIRCDLHDLADAGKMMRVHGGVLRSNLTKS